jgi:hypothetical protein
MRHPGKVLYVDGNSGQVLETIDAAEMPDSIRFADTERGRVPVVKVIATIVGDKRYVREYGPNDELLRSTVQLKNP